MRIAMLICCVLVLALSGTTCVLAFGSATLRVDLEEMEKLEKAREKLGRVKLGLSPNFTDP